MRIELEEPYKSIFRTGTLVTDPKRKKRRVHLNGFDGSLTTVHYDRYLMSIKLGSFLSSEFEVIHLDGDETNDSIENLEVLTREEYRGRLTHVSEELLAVIDGIVAGDGHITRATAKNGNAALVLGLGSKQAEHAREFADRIRAFGFTGRVRDYHNLSTGLSRFVVQWTSPVFGPQRQRWYPNGVKQLPVDLSNSSEMWRWLYAGDGTIDQCSNYGSKLKICVQSFTLPEIERLASMLMLHDIEAWPVKNVVSTKIRPGEMMHDLQLSTKSTRKFLDMTWPPVKGLEYKWRMAEAEPKICGCCNTWFTPPRVDAIYCSPRCSVRANHPAYSTDPIVLEAHRKKRREYERDRRSKLPGYFPRPNNRI